MLHVVRHVRKERRTNPSMHVQPNETLLVQLLYYSMYCSSCLQWSLITGIITTVLLLVLLVLQSLPASWNDTHCNTWVHAQVLHPKSTLQVAILGGMHAGNLDIQAAMRLLKCGIVPLITGPVVSSLNPCLADRQAAMRVVKCGIVALLTGPVV
jgi:hypothetical protein